MTLAGIATSARAALEEVRRTRPDLVLVDIGLPDGDGISLGRAMLDEVPGTRLVALTALEDETVVQDAIRSGFHGYVTKNTEPAKFTRALESVADGQVVFPHRLGRNGSSNSSNGDVSPVRLLAGQLTGREMEVLELLAGGASGRDIATRLHISPNTVRTHVQGILSKLQVHSRLEAAAFAIRHGLVDIRTAAGRALR